MNHLRNLSFFVLRLSICLTGVFFDPGLGTLAVSHAGGFENILGSRFQSTRGLGMGDAFLPLVDSGAEALFYQPAAIAKLETTQIEPVNITLEGNTAFFNAGLLDNYKLFALPTASAKLQTVPNQSPGYGLSALAGFGFRGFAAGVLFDERFMARDVGGNIQYRSMMQFIPAVGVGIPLANGIVRLGYSLHFVNRVEASGIVAPAAAVSYTEGGYKGYALSHNAGFQLTLPYQAQPSLNIAFRNIFGVVYQSGGLVPLSSGSVVGLPPSEPMTIDTSASIHIKVGGGSIYNFVLMGRDLFNASNTDIFRRVGFGMEFGILSKIFIRLGWMQYPTAGLGFKGNVIEVNLGLSSENLGSNTTNLQDWQFRVQIKIGKF